MTADAPRIVSLLPSATEIVCRLGLQDALVGVTHECDHPSGVAGKPRLTASRIAHQTMSSVEIDHAVRSQLDGHGSIYDLDETRLRALAPDLILTQELCEVCAVSYRTVEQAARRLDTDTAVVSLEPNTISDILANIRTVGELTGTQAEAGRVVGELRARLDALGHSSAGLTPADPDGTVQATAHRDGTVVLHLTCGDGQAEVRLDVCRAAQLSTGIWEAADAAQRLTVYLGDDQLPPSQPPNGSGDLPEAWRGHHRSAPPRDRSPMPRRRPPLMNTGAAMDATRAIGLRIRRVREARDKSLRVISGLAGMSSSTLHRIEHGRRELTLSEIVVLANALEIAPAKLTTSTILAPTDR